MAKKSIWSERYIALEIGQSYEIIANYKYRVCEQKLRQTIRGGHLPFFKLLGMRLILVHNTSQQFTAEIAKCDKGKRHSPPISLEPTW